MKSQQEYMKNVSTIYLFSQFLLNFPSMPFSSDFRDKLIEQLKGTFGKYYDYHRRDIAANEVDYLNVEDPDVFSHRAWELEYQRKQEIRRNQPARTKKRSYDMEL